MNIRPIEESDAAAFVELRQQLDTESSFMLFEPGERVESTDAQREQIRAMQASGDRTVLVAEEAGTLLGFVGATMGVARRVRHTATTMVGVRREAWGRGVGRALLARVEAWARTRGVTRIELSVMTHNLRALRLYLQAGFEIEGRRRRALIVDGDAVDAYWMARLLG